MQRIRNLTCFLHTSCHLQQLVRVLWWPVARLFPYPFLICLHCNWKYRDRYTIHMHVWCPICVGKLMNRHHCKKTKKYSDRWYASITISGDFLELPRRANISAPIDTDQVANLHNSSLSIKASKYKHLQELKSVVPRNFHALYDNLQHA